MDDTAVNSYERQGNDPQHHQIQRASPLYLAAFELAKVSCGAYEKLD
jgi:hypothetical protein